MKKRLTGIVLALMTVIFVAGCTTEADTVTYNMKKEADDFGVQRSVVFFNGITDEYLLQVEGMCSLGNGDNDLRMTVTCKVGEDQYKMHTLGLSDNVSFFSEQLDPNKVDPYHYKVTFRPEAIVPDIDIQTSNE